MTIKMSKAAVIAICLLPWLPGAASAQVCAPPAMLFALDKSESMREQVGEDTKWAIATNAIRTILGPNEDHIQFGLMIFPYEYSCQVGEVVVDPALYTAHDITHHEAFYTDPFDESKTPIYRSLKRAREFLTAEYPNDRKVVVLITDGKETCHEGDHVALVEQMRLENEIRTFVIGFGTSVDAVVLNGMAWEGGTAKSSNCDKYSSDPQKPDNCYYYAGSQEELDEALQVIAEEVAQERCNGFDDDCDNYTDEDLGFVECGLGICHHKAHGCIQGEAADCDPFDIATDEECNGLDDDCDGEVDEGDLCEPDLVCACGACVEACHAGECFSAGVCIAGACIEEDSCPEHYLCEGKECRPDPDSPPPVPIRDPAIEQPEEAAADVGQPEPVDTGTVVEEEPDTSPPQVDPEDTEQPQDTGATAEPRQESLDCACDFARQPRPSPTPLLFGLALLLLVVVWRVRRGWDR